ncbi:MAG: hypothetical protein KJO00_05420 [Bacteroidia bacterium]|nr:hypothetical protein [Bacteroidia bacterium]NNF81834.1 hypothetical protein [Flavobacteriaceae bacterium]
MKSLKITLLLAVFCIALMGVTYSSDQNTSKTDDVENVDLNDNKYNIAHDHKKAKTPPQA